jgi:predicted DNA-binding transcriptional regulator YafY
MSEDPPLVRQWILLRKLAAHRSGLTVREMSREMEVTEKTIRRDLDLFRSLGMPLREEIAQRGCKRWSLPALLPEAQLGFRFDEALALYLGRQFLEPLAGTTIWESMQSAFRKIRATLTPEALEYLARHEDLIHRKAAGISDYSRKDELIDALMIAIEDGKAVHITYRSRQATEPATRELYPYGMVYNYRSLYLVAFSPEQEEIRHYKVNRMEAVEASPWPFQRPKSFDIRTHLAGSFGVYQGSGECFLVRVRFSSDVARYVTEARWHASQKLTAQRDGSLLAEFMLNTTEEIKSWVLGFGVHAVVLEPTTLRDEMRAEIQNMIGLYESPPSVTSVDGRVRDGPLGIVPIATKVKKVKN